MPQGRILLKRICQSRKLAQLKTDGARLLYTWLIPNLDANGCFSGDPDVIKGQIFTRLKKSKKIINNYLFELQSVGLLIIYESNGDQYLQIPDFVDKQPYLNRDRESKTTIPPPTQEQLMSKSGAIQGQSKSKSKSKIYSELFLEFWEKFKGRWNEEKHRFIKGGKMEAFIEWENLNEEEQAKAIKAAPMTGSKITKDACRWLKYHRWEDFEGTVNKQEQKAANEQKQLERERERIRKEDGQFYREQTPETLKEMLTDSKKYPLHVTRRWLIKEILQEIENLKG